MNKGIISYSFASIRFYLTSPQKRKLVWLFLLTLVSSFMEVLGLASLVPVMMVAAEPGGITKSKYFGPIYHSMGFQTEPRFLLFLIVLIFLFFLIKNIFTTWVNYITVRFTAEVGINIIKNQLKKYLNLPFWHFNDYGSGSLINSTLAVPNAYVNGVMRPLFSFFSEIVVVCVIILGIMLYKPLLLVLLAVVLVPTTILSYRVLRTRSQNIGNRINELRPASFSIIGDLFNGFTELKLANKQHRFRERLLVNQGEVQNLDADSYLFGLLPTKMIEMVAIIGILTIFLYAIFFPSTSTNLIALVGLFAGAAYRLMPSVNRILISLVQLKQFQYTIENLESYRGAEFNEAPHPQQLPLTFKHSLVFENLSFSFPNEQKPTLRNINVKIRKGEKIGFIGSSGSGKTTLMNVLLRFYTEQQGAILIDGQPLTPQHLHAWHNIVGYVKQDTFLMEASIQDNITLGDLEVDEERMRYAIEQASLQTFIAGLPEGLNTLIGERGSKLSGGQRQRIGIARALYKQTEVLVLDEATSALDNETEREVNEAINKLSHTAITILIIAHRITTLRECDRIYELSHGELVAEHQYEDLVRKIVELN
ncbi:ABC transporter ATP-binding protein/permease [Hymenobacter sp. DH14]|uniref:ABC transporter ATP-binding protein/permease n=1 Tax=Hymenobacter cyanobacteriorum TaxID=2926463 RepID=A0A9X1VGR1_9BACT|nr:ABC transporter ATP-binding protein [Hymenobacter cyanobacteriorum]MCI1188894.1 ABC transporter ATP-binding protein/permease [Hymenobacter cyanobacteriorum]